MKRKGLVLSIGLVLLLVLTTVDAQAQRCHYYNPLFLPFAVVGAVGWDRGSGSDRTSACAVLPCSSVCGSNLLRSGPRVLRPRPTATLRQARVLRPSGHIMPGQAGPLGIMIVLATGSQVIGDNLSLKAWPGCWTRVVLSSAQPARGE